MTSYASISSKIKLSGATKPSSVGAEGATPFYPNLFFSLMSIHLGHVYNHIQVGVELSIWALQNSKWPPKSTDCLCKKKRHMFSDLRNTISP